MIKELGRMITEETVESTKSSIISKILMSVLGTSLVIIYGALWEVNADIGEMNVKIAELKGAQATEMTIVRELMERGSRTAQRLEVLVESLEKRLITLEEFRAAGPRFTREDGNLLEKRLMALEEKAGKR